MTPKIRAARCKARFVSLVESAVVSGHDGSMTTWFPVLLLVVSGAFMAIQVSLNVALRGSLGTWLFAFIFTVIQLAASLPPLLAMEWPPKWGLLSQTPSWHFLGGLLGVPLLAAMAFGLGRTGTFEGFIALLFGQLGMGIVIDRFGLFNAPMHAISLNRVGGLLLVAAGVWLTRQ
ncbi:MAG: DMT family transporter [Deltaproteobacteria bacterium]|nr:DMT family transporter [Deltaproteobacteria bacterium]